MHENLREMILKTEPVIRELKGMVKSADEKLAILNKHDLAHKWLVIACLEEGMKEVSGIFRKFKDFRLQQFNRLNELVNLNVQRKEQKQNKQNLEQVKEATSESGQLQEENEMLMEKYHKKVEDQKHLISKLTEISEINRKISEVLEGQNITTEKIFKEIDDSIVLVKDSNDNLTKANKLSSEFGRLWAFYFIVLGILLIIFDRIKS